VSDNVVSFREGFATPRSSPEPVESVVKFLESLLERARSGDIIAIAAAYMHHDTAVSDWHAGGVSLSLLGGMDCRKQRMVQEILDLEDSRPPPYFLPEDTA
jgi:hypothetical protein